MPASRHWRKKNVRQSLALPRHPWKPRRRRPITLPMSIETVLALFTLYFVIKATPGSDVFATVGRALFQGFGPTLVFIAGIIAGDLLYLVFALTGLAVIASRDVQLTETLIRPPEAPTARVSDLPYLVPVVVHGVDMHVLVDQSLRMDTLSA